MKWLDCPSRLRKRVFENQSYKMRSEEWWHTLDRVQQSYLRNKFVSTVLQ